MRLKRPDRLLRTAGIKSFLLEELLDQDMSQGSNFETMSSPQDAMAVSAFISALFYLLQSGTRVVGSGGVS